MNEVISRELCCGCGECAMICPVHAITMVTNEKGFRFPEIESAFCINCKKCVNSCAVINSGKLKYAEGLAFGAINLTDEIRQKSSSGGAFTALAETYLEGNGIVYGAISDDNVIRHTYTDAKDGLSAMRGSKYVQSNIEGIFFDIETKLKEGQKVLFSGTPCQCVAIKAYLGLRHVETCQLVLVDMVCHGVCSPMVFRDYISFCESRSGEQIEQHIFRSKENGWRNHTEKNVMTNGKKDYTSFDSQLFKSFFHSHFALRDSCFNCRFTTTQRVSDITMADFWGLQKSIPDEYSPEGVSFLMANSEKGKTLIYDARRKMKVFQAKVTDTEQPQLHRPSSKPDGTQQFWQDYKKGFKHVAVKYFHAGRIRRFVTGAIKSIIKV